MHPRNPYAQASPNFAELADAVPEFRAFVTLNSKGAPTINFKDPAALRALTKALLQRDFRLAVDFPLDRLCPAIPGRLDYILFLQDVIEADRKHRTWSNLSYTPEIFGLDIGIGASAVYPLLFSRVDSNVHMIGTDIDETSLETAQANIDVNQLENRLSAMRTDSSAGFFEGPLAAVDSFDFTMCNPPFYSSQAELEKLASEKEFSPHAVCTCSPAEMVTQGGEATYVLRMVQESQAIGQRIKWFSSLLGKGSSVRTVVEELATRECLNYAAVEFSQGFTQRWAIAWSWQDIHLPDAIARQLPSGPLTKSLPLPNTIHYICSPSLILSDVARFVESALQELDGLEFVPAGSEELLVRASYVSWTRAARRAKQRGEAPRPAVGESNLGAVLTCTIAVTPYESEKKEQPASSEATGEDGTEMALTETHVKVACSWIRGTDRQAFETFFNHLKTKITAFGREAMD